MSETTETSVEATSAETASPETQETANSQPTAPSAAEQQEIANALKLYRGMGNPETGRQIVENLARTFGIVVDHAGEKLEKQTPAEKKTLESAVKEALGPDYAFMSDKMAKAISVAVAQEVAERTASINEEVFSSRISRIEQDIDSATNHLESEFEISEEIATKVTELMQTRKPFRGQKPYDYAKSLLFEASAEIDKPLTKKTIARNVRTQRTAQDPFGNLRNFKGGGNSKSAPTGKMSLNEAVLAALEDVS